MTLKSSFCNMDIMSFPSVEGMVRNDGKMTPKQMYILT